MYNSKQKTTMNPPELMTQLQWWSGRDPSLLIHTPLPFLSSYIIYKQVSDIISQ